MNGLLLSVVVVFVAELGDKSQLIALTFATRFATTRVLIGITAATAVVHALAVLVGAALGAALPTRAMNLTAAAAFAGFAIWTLHGDRLSSDDERRATRPVRHVTLAVGSVFLLAELGDKTMFATITLATSSNILAVWLGSTIGMVAADALAIVIGRQLGAKLPDRAVRVGAAIAFCAFSAVLFVNAL